MYAICLLQGLLMAFDVGLDFFPFDVENCKNLEFGHQRSSGSSPPVTIAAARSGIITILRQVMSTAKRAHLIGRTGKPLRIDVDAPAGTGGNRSLAVANCERVAEEETFLPGIVVGPLD